MCTIETAIATLKLAGYRVTKIKAKVVKDRVGPTFVATFADGQVTRMSTYTSLAKLDVDRALRLARHAYASRHHFPAEVSLDVGCPPIREGYFEQDGEILAMYDFANNQIALAA